MAHNPSGDQERQLSRDSDTIREWADKHDAVPVREAGPEEDTFRMVPEGQVGADHEEVEWSEFFDQLDTGDHVVIYHGEDATEPFEVAGQRDVADRVGDEEIEQRLLDGETVTSTITETAVVESVVVEEITIDSELIDTEIVDERVVDVELLGREATNCDVIAEETADDREWFDTDRYFDAVTRTAQGGAPPGPGTESEPVETGAGSEPVSTDVEPGEFPFHAELDVEETWRVTRAFDERFVVESRVTDTEVTEAETIEDYDVDVEGLHRSIIESGIIEEGLHPEDALAQYDIESELADQDRITTTFTREGAVTDEIADHRRLFADVTDSEAVDFRIVHTESVEPVEATEGGPAPGGEATHTDEVEGDVAPSTAGTGTAGERITITEDAIGKAVVDANGEEIGMVSDIDEESNSLYVDPQPGLTARIQAALGWGDVDDDNYYLEGDQISRITEDRIELKSPDDLNQGSV